MGKPWTDRKAAQSDLNSSLAYLGGDQVFPDGGDPPPPTKPSCLRSQGGDSHPAGGGQAGLSCTVPREPGSCGGLA